KGYVLFLDRADLSRWRRLAGARVDASKLVEQIEPSVARREFLSQLRQLALGFLVLLTLGMQRLMRHKAPILAVRLAVLVDRFDLDSAVVASIGHGRRVDSRRIASRRGLWRLGDHWFRCDVLRRLEAFGHIAGPHELAVGIGQALALGHCK